MFLKVSTFKVFKFAAFGDVWKDFIMFYTLNFEYSLLVFKINNGDNFSNKGRLHEQITLANELIGFYLNKT